MNHLAHFHLAGDCPGHLTGALLADYLRGPLRGLLPAAVEAGVRLHRRIDACTDAHPVVRNLRGAFPAGERRLAGIVLDLYFDLFLARRWERFDDRALREFSTTVHAVLRAHHHLLPEAGRVHAGRIEEYDLLCRYADEAVVRGALARIGARLGCESAMLRAVDTAGGNLAEIEAGFLVLYPELLETAASFRASAAS
jgi:acyl carrier protein phosphodiesterase